MEREISTVKFGQEMREREFCLRKNSTFLNHGSYGAVPRRIKELQKKYLDELDEHPDLWYRHKAPSYWKNAVQAAADFVHAEAEDIVLVQNATTGVNTILKSYKFRAGDAILINDNTYLAVQNACDNVISNVEGGKVHTLNVTFPINDDQEIVDMYRKFLQNHPEVKIAVIDHITSPTGLLFPVKELVSVCREFNVLSLIDGAHALGQLPLNLPELNPDFYTSNFHKWCFTPRTCALLYVKKEHQKWVKPVVTSFGYKQGMSPEFYPQGTRDIIPYFCIPEAIKFYNDIGGIEVVPEYSRRLLDDACKLLTQEWGTHELPVPRSMVSPCLRMIKLPEISGFEQNWMEAERLVKQLSEKFNTETTIISVHGPFYVRLSCSIYVHMGDILKLKEALDSLRARTEDK